MATRNPCQHTNHQTCVLSPLSHTLYILKEYLHMHIKYLGTLFPLQALYYMKLVQKRIIPHTHPLKENPIQTNPQQTSHFRYHNTANHKTPLAPTYSHVTNFQTMYCTKSIISKTPSYKPQHIFTYNLIHHIHNPPPVTTSSNKTLFHHPTITISTLPYVDLSPNLTFSSP
jgi:hypothetical protein